MAEVMNDRTMLCLAGLAYRGFNEGTMGHLHTEAVGRAIGLGLKTLKPLDEKWELVWGPVAYRAPLSVLDDSLMYVARHRGAPNNYAVVIRGTNPISAFDWVFGDLWTGCQVPWPYDHEARISLSTALGLALLRGLRSERPHADEGLWDAIRARIGSLLDFGGQDAAAQPPLASWLSKLATAAVAPLRLEFSELLGRLAVQRKALAAVDADGHVKALTEFWKSDVRRLLLDLVARAAERLGDRLDLALLALLEDEARLRASLGHGIDVIGFLAAAVESSPKPLHVSVVGHSKGAGLASTLALALAETQGQRKVASEQWDPEGSATVHCYSYAGPTAGDAAFARRSDAKIGARCHRIANTLDVVPHAWALSALAKLPTLYDQAVVAPLPALETLVATIGACTRDLGYTQVGTVVTEFEGKLERAQPLFFHQLVHQHMQAYLEHFDLPRDGVDTPTLFDPLAVLPR